MLVRVDRPGTPESDFHTVSPPPADLALVRKHTFRVRHYTAASGRTHFTVPLGSGEPWKVGSQLRTHISERHYLADAEFLTAFTGPTEVVEALSRAAHQPTFTPYLGRQAFAPCFPFHLGVRDQEGLDVLALLPTTAPQGKVLRVHALSPGRPIQIARVEPPRTTTPLVDWRRA